MSDPSTDPAATSGGGAAPLPAGEWTLDPDNSRAEFAVKHFGGLITVRGHFNAIEGELSIDPAGAVAGELRIDAASVDTGNKQRDKHLRSADFFGADEHPQVVYTPSAARRVDGSGLEMDGRLTIAGHEEPVTLRLDADHAAPVLRHELAPAGNRSQRCDPDGRGTYDADRRLEVRRIATGSGQRMENAFHQGEELLAPGVVG
jgi:polyisoprenoid-binding protein YceI